MKEKVSKVTKKATKSRISSLLNPKKIQIARAKLGMSCADLATKIKVTRQFLSGVETGRVHTNSDRANQIAKILKVKVNDIFKKDTNEHFYSK